jgi:hypothetical protein
MLHSQPLVIQVSPANTSSMRPHEYTASQEDPALLLLAKC